MNKIKNFFVRNRQRIIIIFSVLIFIISLINLYLVLEVRVTSNDECLWVHKRINEDSLAIMFDKVKVNGVAWNAGIRDGDQLLEINNVSLESTSHAQMILNKMSEGEYADYVYKTGSDVKETKVYIKKLVNFPWLALTLFGAIWFLIGFVVVMAKPDGYIQRLFYKIGAAFVLFMMFLWINTQEHFLSIPFIITADMLWNMASLFLPFMILHFFWTFPRRFKFMERGWVKKVLYIIPTLLFIAVAVYKITAIYPAKGNVGPGYQNLINMMSNFFLLIFPVAFIFLTINYFKLKKDERKTVFAILVSFALAIASFIYFIFIATAIAETMFNNPEYFMPIILIAILPISFGYSIFKYQLMDVSVVIKNAIIYGAATLSVAALYFFIIYLVGQTVSEAIGTEYQGIIAGLTFIAFAMVFQSSKDKFQDLLTAKFYPEQFASQKVLLKFSSEVSTLVGLENILDAMSTTFVNALKINQFGIMLYIGNIGEYHLIRSTGISSKDLSIKENNLIRFIKEKKEINKLPVIEHDDFNEVFPLDADKLKEEKIFTVIPMIIKSKVVGFLLFGLKYSGAQFAGKDLELLIAAANQSAISIENARLYESEAQKLKMERDLDLARKIQQNLLPKCIPSMRGLDICGEMIPAMQVGGDYFDLVKISDSQLFVVVGDVSGKGLSASLYMAKLQTMVQMVCTKGMTPKEILVEINRRIYEAMERSSFVTMTVALFDTDTNKVSFCRAGHMPILAAKNGTIESYKTQGIGVGLEKGIIFENTLIEEEVSITSGQIYAFFSDGVTEAMNESDELYGEEALSSILKNKTARTSSQIMDELWGSVKAFRGKAEVNDDMTMVLVKVG